MKSFLEIIKLSIFTNIAKEIFVALSLLRVMVESKGKLIDIAPKSKKGVTIVAIIFEKFQKIGVKQKIYHRKS